MSSYVGKSGTVLAIMNTGAAIEARIDLDLSRLGLERVSGAVDVIRDEKMAVEQNTLTVPLTLHQGRVIVVRP